jgi:hypothetical protein
MLAYGNSSWPMADRFWDIKGIEEPYAISHRLYAMRDTVYLLARLAFQLPPELTLPSMTLPLTYAVY